MSIIRYVGAAEDARVVISFSILKQGRQPSMEDRALRSRHCHGAFVIQAITAVINNWALYGRKYTLGRPYRAMTNMVTYACLLWRNFLNVLLCFTRLNVQTVLFVLSLVVTSVYQGARYDHYHAITHLFPYTGVNRWRTGRRVPPFCSVGRQHKNCPPPLLSFFQKNCGACSLSPLISLKSRYLDLVARQ